MAVGASESRITGAAEVPSRQADAAATRSTHIGWDVPHPLFSVVSCDGNSATINHLGKRNEKEMISKGRAFELFVTIFWLVHFFKMWRCWVTFTLVGLAVVLELWTGFALIVIRTAAVEVTGQAVALSLVLTRVWATGVVLQLQEEKQKMHLWNRTTAKASNCLLHII